MTNFIKFQNRSQGVHLSAPFKCDCVRTNRLVFTDLLLEIRGLAQKSTGRSS